MSVNTQKCVSKQVTQSAWSNYHAKVDITVERQDGSCLNCDCTSYLIPSFVSGRLHKWKSFDFDSAEGVHSCQNNGVEMVTPFLLTVQKNVASQKWVFILGATFTVCVLVLLLGACCTARSQHKDQAVTKSPKSHTNFRRPGSRSRDSCDRLWLAKWSANAQPIPVFFPSLEWRKKKK